MTTVYLGLGSNIGNKKQHIQDAIRELSALGTIRKRSRLYSTEPIGFRDQDWFLNCAVELSTTLDPETLHKSIQAIERKLGRQQTRKNGPRIIDIDILFYGNDIITTPTLTIPHPRLHDRLFVLQPLMDLNPQLNHPVLKKTVKELYEAHRDTAQVIPLTDEINISNHDSYAAEKGESHMRLCQEFVFDAAHYLPQYKGKCEQQHGHTYRLEVVIEKNTHQVTFEQMRSIVKETVIEKLDHQLLNTLFENPTAEIIVEWIATQLKHSIPLVSLKLWEGEGKWVEVNLTEE